MSKSRSRSLVAIAALLVLMVPIGGLRAGNQEMREVVLYGGGNTSAAVDTLELPSPWFSVRGASRVVIRLWSANTSAWTAADSIYADSVVTFKALFSDSVGLIVTSPTGQTIQSAADSVMVDFTVTNPDTATTSTEASRLPINKPLAAAKNGSGWITTILPVLSVAAVADTAIAAVADFPGVFGKSFMRIRVTPLRRMTEGGRLSTAGKRTVGIRGLRGRAYIYFPNR